MWTILKVFIEFASVLLLFYVCFFAREACGISDSHPGIYPGKVLITRPRGKSLKRILQEHEIALLPQVLKLNKCA